MRITQMPLFLCSIDGKLIWKNDAARKYIPSPRCGAQIFRHVEKDDEYTRFCEQRPAPLPGTVFLLRLKSNPHGERALCGFVNTPDGPMLAMAFLGLLQVNEFNTFCDDILGAVREAGCGILSAMVQDVYQPDDQNARSVFSTATRHMREFFILLTDSIVERSMQHLSPFADIELIARLIDQSISYNINRLGLRAAVRHHQTASDPLYSLNILNYFIVLCGLIHFILETCQENGICVETALSEETGIFHTRLSSTLHRLPFTGSCSNPDKLMQSYPTVCDGLLLSDHLIRKCQWQITYRIDANRKKGNLIFDLMAAASPAVPVLRAPLRSDFNRDIFGLIECLLK